VTNIGVCQLHVLVCVSILYVCLGDCGLKSDTGQEFLRRHIPVSHNQVLTGNVDQVWELLLVLFPSHERVCVVDDLLHSHV
jgi:hypothetical protein